MSRQLSDWLEYYMQFTQNSEPPILYHLWSGITAISSVLRRKCYCNWGLRGYVYPNLYVSLVGPPGGRKGTAMKIAKTMLQKLEIPIGSDALGSTQILYKEIRDCEDSYTEHNGMKKNHKSLSVWSEEFQVFLSDNDPMLIASLTDLFDCSDRWKYSTLKRGAEDLSNCWLTIIGAITPSLLQSKLSSDAVGGGLLSRIIFVVGYGPIKRIALPFLSVEEEEMRKKLYEDLEQMALLSGPFILTTDFLQKYSTWYESGSSAGGINDEKFLGYNSRRALHLNKLCMIMSASENDDMKINASHFEKALAVLEETEFEMPNAFYGLGLSATSDAYAKVLTFIKAKENFSWQELVAAFQMHASMTELQEYVQRAEQAGVLRKEHSATNTKYEAIPQATQGKTSNIIKTTLYKRMI